MYTFIFAFITSLIPFLPNLPPCARRNDLPDSSFSFRYPSLTLLFQFSSGTSKCWKIDPIGCHYTCKARYCWLSIHYVDAKPWTSWWRPKFRGRQIFIWSNSSGPAWSHRRCTFGEGTCTIFSSHFNNLRSQTLWFSLLLISLSKMKSSYACCPNYLSGSRA